MCFLVMAPALTAQTEDELKALAMEGARICGQATVDGDFATLMDYTVPTIVELMGGKNTALSSIKAQMKTMENDGFEIVSSEVLKLTGFAFEQNEYRCIIKNRITMNTPKGGLESTSYLFGFYDETAGQWYFTEAKRLKDPSVMEQVFPGMKTSLVIPNGETRFLD